MFNAKKLAEYLENQGLSQKAFGEMVGVSQAMVDYLVRGFKQPSVVLLKRIADVLGCTMDELLADGAAE